MLKGLGAVVTTDYTASCFDNSDDVVFFLIGAKNKSREACIIYKKDIVLTNYAKDFIDMAEVFSKRQM